MNRLLIRNGTIVLPSHNELKNADLLVDNGVIAHLGKTPEEIKGRTIDARGLYISPGFIDLQVNGGVGHNFEDASPEEIRKIVDFYVSHGTTSLLPTTVTAPIAGIRSTIDRVKHANHPAVLGMHIEGPFISEKRKGAQNPDYILDPSVEKLNALVTGHEGFIKIVTLAPERPGADQLISRIREIGAVPSLGHSDATYEQASAAIERGIGLFTHMFNAMREFHHRAPGAVGAGLTSDITVELIADGIHVHPGAMKLLYKAKGPDRICLITDAISAIGLADGEYQLGGLQVFVKDATARLADGTIAGSTLTMDRAVQVFMEASGCSLPEAVKAASLNQARLLRIADRKGSIAVGKDADLVIFDADFNIHYTIIGGEILYSHESNY
jgi:N-acetylglucosamine-6-phosphate deacetylase